MAINLRQVCRKSERVLLLVSLWDAKPLWLKSADSRCFTATMTGHNSRVLAWLGLAGSFFAVRRWSHSGKVPPLQDTECGCGVWQRPASMGWLRMDARWIGDDGERKPGHTAATSMELSAGGGHRWGRSGFTGGRWHTHLAWRRHLFEGVAHPTTLPAVCFLAGRQRVRRKRHEVVQNQAPPADPSHGCSDNLIGLGYIAPCPPCSDLVGSATPLLVDFSWS